MIYVDNQGASQSSDVHYAFRETEWDGFAPADCVFPTFLFIAGLAIPLASSRMRFKAEPQHVWRVALRSLKLFGIGVFLNLWATDFNFHRLVVMGVLQRIGLCYGILAALYLYLGNAWLRVVAAAALGLYCSLMYGLPVPGCGPRNLTATCNTGGYLDRCTFGHDHVPASGTIPEGLLSTCTALCTTWLGLEFGLILVQWRSDPRRLALSWAAGAAVLAGIGVGLKYAVPLNKKLWSPSFLALAASVSGGLLVLFLVLLDLWAIPSVVERNHRSTQQQHLQGPDGQSAVNSAGRSRGRRLPVHNGDHEPLLADAARLVHLEEMQALPIPTATLARGVLALVAPLRWLGRNPALVFIGMVALEIFLMDTLHTSWKADGAQQHGSAWEYLYMQGFAQLVGAARAASSLFATVHLVLWVAVAGILDRAKIYITL